MRRGEEDEEEMKGTSIQTYSQVIRKGTNKYPISHHVFSIIHTEERGRFGRSKSKVEMWKN